MTTQVTNSFPNSKDEVKNLVEEHRKLLDEPVILAVYYAPERNYEDVFLFEILDNFGANSVGSDEQMFEVVYRSTPSFPLYHDQQLRIVLTNPAEFETAAKNNWKHIYELREAKRDGKFQIIYQDANATNLLKLL